MVLRARGHASIRAEHAKTLEVTRETAITGRATCVVGVAAEFDPVSVALLRGPVRVTVAADAGGPAVSGTGVINPYHAVRDRVVIRRSGATDPDTLVIHSTLTARDLGGDLVPALADPTAEVVVTVEELPEAQLAPLVLLGTAGAADAPGRPGTLWRHADVTVYGSTALPSPDDLVATGRAPVVAVALDGPVELAPPTVTSWLVELGRRGARFDPVPPGSPVAPALLAAGLPAAPALWLGRLDARTARRTGTAGRTDNASRADVADLLRSAPPVPAVLLVPPSDARQVLGSFAALRPQHPIAVPDGTEDVGTAMRWVTAGEAVAAVEALPDRYAAVVVAADPGVQLVDAEAVVRLLTEAGVSRRVLGTALKPLGVDRRRLYGTGTAR